MAWTRIVEKIELDPTKEIYVLAKNKTLPYSYNVFIEKNKLEEHNVEINEQLLKYAYYNPLENEKEIHYFDSNNEISFINQIKKAIKENNYHYAEKIRFWSRNPVFNGFGFSYFDHEDKISNSYPDFILLLNNHKIYIEAKSNEADYNSAKTIKIVEGYKKYINSNLKANKIIHEKLTLLVASHDVKTKKTYFKGASVNQ